MTTNDVRVCVYRCPSRLGSSTNKEKSQVKMAFGNLKHRVQTVFNKHRIIFKNPSSAIHHIHFYLFQMV